MVLADIKWYYIKDAFQWRSVELHMDTVTLITTEPVCKLSNTTHLLPVKQKREQKSRSEWTWLLGETGCFRRHKCNYSNKAAWTEHWYASRECKTTTQAYRRRKEKPLVCIYKMCLYQNGRRYVLRTINDQIWLTHYVKHIVTKMICQ